MSIKFPSIILEYTYFNLQATFVKTGEVTIIAIGSLTNIALATRLDKTFIENVGELIIMGSTVSGNGNEGPNLEFNIAVDPESAFIVMNSTKKLFTLVPWEISLNFQISKVF